jgi:hypothetical protein
MASETAPSMASGKLSFRIQGQVKREQPDVQSADLKLAVYVFDILGMLLGSSGLDAKGSYSVGLPLARPVDVELMIGPAGMEEQVRSSNAYRQRFSAGEWQQDQGHCRITFDVLLPLQIWRPWLPTHICVSGHIRKIISGDGNPRLSPVPYVKVEIFDVDREPCFWPLLRNWWEWLLDRRVIRIPELMRDPPSPPRPFPGPDPVPAARLGAVPGLGSVGSSILQQVAINPQPEPPRPQVLSSTLSDASVSTLTSTVSQALAYTRVGEARLMDSSIAARLENLTLTSRTAPWSVYPRCFYSKTVVGEAFTDGNGLFSCCFNWWPFCFRRGRLRFDSRPDIVLKVTQVIDGVATIIYLDPYTSTRWDVTTAHIDLCLDDENIACGAGTGTSPPVGRDVFFTLVGNDPVHEIDQADGTYSGGGFAKAAYGGQLDFKAVFGKGLTEAADPYYYRLSVAPVKAPADGARKTVNSALSDTRVHFALDPATGKTQAVSESYVLGPKIVNQEPALYEIRKTDGYYWYDQALIGHWFTPPDVPDAGKYTVRLEVFDKNGHKLTSSDVTYQDGTAAPPAVLPPMHDRCDLVLQIDNVAPTITIDVPKAANQCGVVDFASLPFSIKLTVNQPHERLYSWSLKWGKGLSQDGNTMGAGTTPPDSFLVPVVKTYDSAAFTGDLTSTCAFSLVADAWSNVRNGYHCVYYVRAVKAVAVAGPVAKCCQA